MPCNFLKLNQTIMSLLLEKAPKFTAPALVDGQVVQNFSLEQYLDKQYVVLFFYPKDFSGVCPTEMWALQESLAAFAERETAVVACSTDTEEVHQAWVNTPRDKNGIEGITFPIIADTAKTIASNFGVLGGYSDIDDDGNATFVGAPVALRGTYIINKKGMVMYESHNFFTIARNIPSVMRELDALRNFEVNGEICLANWKAEVAV